MDLNAESYEFLDLSDIEDSERKKLIRTLYNKNNNNYEETSTQFQDDKINQNDNGIKLNSKKIKGKSTNCYGTNNINSTTKKEFNNYKISSTINNEHFKYYKNVATSSTLTNNNNHKTSSDNNNNIGNNCQTQTQQLLSINESSLQSGHLIRNLVFPVPPQFLPARLIPPLPLCAIVKPTLTEAVNNSIINPSSTTAVVPLRTPILTASAAVKSHEELQLRKNNFCANIGEELPNWKSDNNTSNNLTDLSSENSSSTLSTSLIEEIIETETPTKAVAKMAQHTQPSLHQQQSQQLQSQQHIHTQQAVVAQQQQNNNYLQHQNQHVATYAHMPNGVFMPAHGGTMYSMMPAPPSVYVNNVTANVNLNGWAGHSMPSTYIPGHAYMTPSEMSQSIVHDQLMQQVQHTNSIPRGNRRGRSSGGGRGNNGNRRNDYNQRNQQQEASPGPQELGTAVEQPQSYHSYGGYPYSAYPHFFTAQGLNHAQAQHATGTPLYMFSQPMYNCPSGSIFYSPQHMIPQEYSMIDDRSDDQTQQQQQQQQHIDSSSMITAQQHPQQMAWHPHVMPIEYQEEYDMNQVGIGEDINHNQSPLTASDHTPSMLSPSGGYQIHYDPNIQQTIDVQQQMNALHIYDQQVVMAQHHQHQVMQQAAEEQNQQMQEQQQHHMQAMHEQPQVMMIIPDMNDYRHQPQIESEQQEIDSMGSNVNEIISSEISQHPSQIITAEQHIYMQQQQLHQQQTQLIIIPNNNIPAVLKHENNLVIMPDFNQNVPNIQEVETIVADNLPTNVNTNLQMSPNILTTNNNDEQIIHQNESIIVQDPTIISTNNISNVPTENSSLNSPSTLIPVNAPAVQAPIPIPSSKTSSWSNQTKKLTASVAVTATPIQSAPASQKSSLSQPLSNSVSATNKPNGSKDVTMPTQIKNQIANKTTGSPIVATTASIINSEKKFINQQTEQKSIGSAVIPQQLQESSVHIKKQETIIIENQAQKVKRSNDELKQQQLPHNMNNINQPTPTVGNLAPPPTAPQTQTTTAAAPSGQLSWASLFASESAVANNQYANSSINNNSNNSSTTHQTVFNNSVGSSGISHSKPVAKVSPYEGTSNIPTPQSPPPLGTGNSAGVLSYSAASSRGIPATTPSGVNAPTSGGTKQKSVVAPQLLNPSNEDNLDEWSSKFADFLRKYKTDFSSVSLRPRGLTNPFNYCYINSVLQALVACPPFYNLLKSMPKQSIALHNENSKIPTINAMVQFANEFYNLPAGARINRREKGQKNNNKTDDFIGELQCDPAFEATSVYKLWNLSRSEIDEGRQGDAEEFLGFVLNKLNDEMLEIIKILAKPVSVVEQNGEIAGEPDDGGDDWQMIYNNKNKGSVTRQADFGNTPISDIFRGELRSRLQREGEHSTDVIQPFFTLQLNIEKAASVREALEILVGRDQLEGVTCSKTNQEVVAWQQMNLEKLPYVLILHLKWFDYKMDGCTKIVKNVGFPVELKIDTKILASKKYTLKQKYYRLFAVVYHDGKEATKGHYITDVYHTGYGSWLRCDDQNVKPISEASVLRPRGLRVPYLLYYRRCDTIATLPSTTQTSTNISSTTTSQNQSNK